MRRTFATAVFVACWASGVAHANEATEPCERDGSCPTPFTEWSWLAEVSGLVTYGQNQEATPIIGAELRVRHNADLVKDPSLVWSVGAAVETLDFDTLEPAAMVGVEPLRRLCKDCDVTPMYGSVRLALGGGALFDSAHTGEPFGLARLSAGIVIGRPYAFNSVHMLSAELEVVVEAQLAADGKHRLSFGIAVDPFRIVQDAIAFNR